LLKQVSNGVIWDNTSVVVGNISAGYLSFLSRFWNYRHVAILAVQKGRERFSCSGSDLAIIPISSG
jgi:hypothetical protein